MGTPSLMAAQSLKIIKGVNQASADSYRRCVMGGYITANATSTISSYVVTLKLDRNAGSLICTPYRKLELAAAAADTFSDTWDYTVAAAARDNYAAVIVDCSSGTAVTKAVWGTEAVTGSATAPTDAEVSSALGHHDWARMCDVLMAGNAAGNAIVVTVDNTARSGLSIGEFDGDLSFTEDGFNG